MRAGDRVKFRINSKAWKSCGLSPNAQGIVVDIYRAAMRGYLKIDVRFDGTMRSERGIDIEEMEVVREPPISPTR
ncbi:MAG: hypothetical protein ACHQAY_12220 [Hyphomicrobiales bacterium]